MAKTSVPPKPPRTKTSPAPRVEHDLAYIGLAQGRAYDHPSVMLTDWQGLLERQPIQTRQILRMLLHGRLGLAILDEARAAIIFPGAKKPEGALVGSRPRRAARAR